MPYRGFRARDKPRCYRCGSFLVEDRDRQVTESEHSVQRLTEAMSTLFQLAASSFTAAQQ